MYIGYERYAVAWLPDSADALSAFTRDWTGKCQLSGERVPRRPLSEVLLDQDLAPIPPLLAGMLVAPFRLRPGVDPFEISRVLIEICERTESFAMPALRLEISGGTVALRPIMPSRKLLELADLVESRVLRRAESRGDAPCCMGCEAGDWVQAPDPSEITDGPPRGRGFEVPLTLPLPAFRAAEVVRRLSPHLAPALDTLPAFDSLVLLGDRGTSQSLCVLERFSLRPARHDAGPDGITTYGPRLLTC